MKKLIMVSLAIFCLVSIGNAQERRGGKMNDKVKSMRIAYLSEKLDLTPEEAQQFWPVFNAYENEKHELKKSFRGTLKAKDIKDMTEAEAENAVLALLTYEEKDLNLKRQFIQDLKGVLTMKKVAKLMRAERTFKEKVIKKLGERRGERREGRKEEGARN